MFLCVSLCVCSALGDTTPSGTPSFLRADTSAAGGATGQNGPYPSVQEKGKPISVSPGTRTIAGGAVEIVPWSLFTAEEVDSIMTGYPLLRRAVLEGLIAGGVPGTFVWTFPRTQPRNVDALRFLPMTEFERMSLSGERLHILFDTPTERKIAAPQISAKGVFQWLYALLK